MQIVECNALPTLILMLGSEDAAIHYEAVRNLLLRREFSYSTVLLLIYLCGIDIEITSWLMLLGWSYRQSSTFISKH